MKSYSYGISKFRHFYECQARATRVRHEQHECDSNCDTSATRVENFDFDSDSSKNIFLHPYIYYMAREGLQGEEQFYSKNKLLEILVSMPKCV